MSHLKLEIPEHLSSFIEVEDCTGFNTERYCLTPQMEECYNNLKAIFDNNVMSELRKLDTNFLNSLLLYGLPGTGKTTFAKFVAHQLDMDLIYVNFANLLGGLGDANKKIHDIFRFIADKRCIFLLDEIDCITTKRTRDSDNVSRIMQSTTITVMQELDYYKSQKIESCIIAATNRVDILDDALRSRFAVELEMKPFSNIEKENYLKNYLSNAGIAYDEKEIELYCAHNSRLELRNMEADMVRGIIKWIISGKKSFKIEHIK